MPLKKPASLFLLAEAVLAVIFVASFIALWRTVPTDSVKLHGNIDTGVDLLGRRVELAWVAATAALVTLGNGGLALWLRSREPVAALFLLGSTAPLLAGLTGALLFISFLNTPR